MESVPPIEKSFKFSVTETQNEMQKVKPHTGFIIVKEDKMAGVYRLLV
jgi:hypothetical protein